MKQREGEITAQDYTKRWKSERLCLENEIK